MIAALLLGLLLQASPSASPQPEPKPGVIRGRITAGDTGKPLRRVRVNIQRATDAGGRLTANTNALGLFEAKNIPPGSYYVSAASGGYLTVQYGQRRPLERGLIVDVSEAAVVDKIDLTLPRAGVIGGRITDELGEPYPGVSVDVLGTRYDHGKRVPAPAGGTTTDDLGHYRISGLPPGTYYVVASSTETWRTEKQESVGYASTYYPGGAADLAQRVTLGPSQQRTDLDFSLIASRTARITGRVQSETGEPVAAPQVTIAYSFPGVMLNAGARTVRGAGDGSFEIKDVSPGSYVLLAGGEDRQLTVAGADIDDLTLVRKIGSTVSGTLVTDDDTRPAFQPSGIRVLLEAPSGHVLPTVRVASFEPDWSFKMTNLGGPFLFRMIGLPETWALRSVRLADRDITDSPWDVPTGGKAIGGMKIVITQKIGRVSGSVVDEAGQPTVNATIVVFAEDENLWMPGSRFVRFTRPARDGTFSISGLPAGTYRAVARVYIEDGQWEDRTFLEEVRDSAPRFVLTDGGAHTLSLKVPAVR